MISLLMTPSLYARLRTPYFLTLGSSRVVLVGKEKKILFNQAGLVARSKKTGAFIAFGDEAAELAKLGTKEILTEKFCQYGVLRDESLCLAYLAWMRASIPTTWVARLLPLPVVVGCSVGMEKPYQELLAGCLRGAAIMPLVFSRSVVADAALVAASGSVQDKTLVIHIGASHTQIALVHEHTVIASTMIRMGGDDVQVLIAQMIRLRHDLSVPLSFLTTIKEAYTKSLSSQARFSQVVRGRRARTGAIASAQLSSVDIEPVLERFFTTLARLVAYEIHETLRLGLDETNLRCVLSGGMSVFPHAKTALTSVLGMKVQTVSRPSIASALGLCELW